LESDPDVNLCSVVQSDTKAFTKKVMSLFAVRRKMQNNMTVLGTHESDPWHFVENAMIGTTDLNKISAYYSMLGLTWPKQLATRTSSIN
jgi:hypothetical protein